MLSDSVPSDRRKREKYIESLGVATLFVSVMYKGQRFKVREDVGREKSV